MGHPAQCVSEDLQPGTVISGFNLQTPLNDETCRAHILHNLTLGLPDALRRAGLTVIANGPSARNVNLANIEGHTIALNGALKLFTDKGLSPDYWAACDPQACVADFLPENPPHNTTYLVASKCHPSVFHKLRHNDVLVWHLKDQDAPGQHRISLCQSITLCASWLMYRMGYTDFEYWGWDGCFIDGTHHAGSSPDVNYEQVHINIGGKLDKESGEVIGGRTFPSTRTWAAEAQAAHQFFQLANYFDIGVTVNGDGMFKAAREFLFEGDTQ